METSEASTAGEQGTTLTQRRGLFGRQSLSILEDRLVRRIRGISNSREDAFLFTEMRENPARIRNCPWMGYLAILPLLGLAAFFFYLATTVRQQDSAGLYAAGIILALFGLGGLYAAVKKTFHVVVFITVRGPLLIQHNRPSADAYRSFMQSLQEKIADSRSIEKRTIKNVLRALRQADLLDEWKYREACKRFDIRDEDHERET